MIFFRWYVSVDRPDPTDERKDLASNFGTSGSLAVFPDPLAFFARFASMVLRRFLRGFTRGQNQVHTRTPAAAFPLHLAAELSGETFD
jgi:hypothetical protein